MIKTTITEKPTRTMATNIMDYFEDMTIAMLSVSIGRPFISGEEIEVESDRTKDRSIHTYIFEDVPVMKVMRTKTNILIYARKRND